MGKKTAIFAENQHVYAKVRGFSPWPAKVSGRRETCDARKRKKIQETGKP